MTAQEALLILTGLAAYFDVRTRRIPNWVSLAGCAAGLAWNTSLAGLAGLRFAGLGLAVGFALYFPLWLLGARGAGDVKLLAAAGSLIGAYQTLTLAVFAALVGGVLALAVVIAKGATLETALNIGTILSSLARLERPSKTLKTPGAIGLPHGLVIFLTTAILEGFRNG